MKTIDCKSPEGNIFVILIEAKQICKRTGYPFEELQEKVLGCSNYDEALDYIESALGDHIEFKRLTP